MSGDIGAGVDRRLIVDRRRGVRLGVCRGAADISGVPVGLVRLGAVFLTIAGLGLPGIVCYLAAGWILGGR